MKNRQGFVRARVLHACLLPILFLLLCPSMAQAQAYSVGDRVQAIDGGGYVIRSSAAGADTGYRTVAGRLGTVTAGPTYAALSGTWYWWYNVNWDGTSQDGWSIEAAIGLAPETITPPGSISGEANPIQGTSYSYTVAAASSSAGHTLQYSFDWGDGTSSSWSTSRTASHSWSSTGQKIIIVTARCQTHTSITANNSPGNYVTVQSASETISPPGSVSGEPDPILNTSYLYTVGAASSSLGHTLQYSFDWGDGTSSSWSTSRSASHSWSTTGLKIIIVTARCQSHTSISANNSPGNSVTVTTPSPSISSVSPNPITADAGNAYQTLTINGANFVNKPSITLTWTGQPNYSLPASQVTFVSSSQLTISIRLGAEADSWTVKATNPDGKSSNVEAFEVLAPATIPAAPGFLETQSFSTRIELGWTDNSNNETGFKIERKTGSGSWGQIATIGANAGSAAYYTDNTTVPHTIYSYRVRAYNSAGDSPYGPEVTAVITPGGPPGAFTLSNDPPEWDPAIPGPKVQLHWTASADVGNYTVYRNGTQYAAGISGTSYLNSANLTGGATYTYFIRASNAEGTTDTDTISVTMPSGPQPGPTAPSGLAAFPAATLVSLAWSDNSNDETGFKIERKTGAAGTWSQIGTTGADVAAFIDGNVAGGVTYVYRVRAYNASGNSSYCGELYVTTPASASQVTVDFPNGGETATAGASFQPSWTVTGSTAAFSTFKVEYSTTAGSQWNLITYCAAAARSTMWAVPAGLATSQARIRVTAYNSTGGLIATDTSDANFTISAPGSRPVAAPDCNNNAPSYGQSVQFYGNWSYVAPGLSIASYAWDFDDGTTSTARNPSHTFNPSATRTYTVRLTVTDSAGTPSSPQTLYVTVTGQALGPNTPQSKSDDPVNLATGNFVYDHADLTIPGIGFPFTFQRFYNSKDTGNTSGPMGAYWSHSYNVALVASSGVVRVTFGDGRSEMYTNSAGAYQAEAGIYNALSTNAAGTFTLTTKEQTRYNFNAQGRLASIVDKNSNTLSLAYSGAGAISAVTNSAGRAVTFVNDANSRIVRMVDPLSRTNVFEYSAEGDLVSATDPRGGVTRYGYDAEHQMTNAVDPNGNQFVRNVYSLNRVVEAQRDALGNVTTFTYDFVTRETVVSNALGFRQVHKHDERLRVVQITDEAGNIQNFEYDDFNNRTKVVDKNRRATSYTYDAKGNVTSKTDPAGNVTVIGYDPRNNPTNRVDAKAGRTVFGFDGNGNLTATVNPATFTNTVLYSTRGLPVLIQDANGNALSNAYDSAGNLVLTRDALGQLRTYTHDAAGRKVAEVDPNSATNRFAYDANNNLVATVDPMGFTNVFAYDANNNQVLIQDARGHQTIKTYDPKDRLVSVRDALGGVTSNAYDALDRRIATTDPRGNVTRFAYDPVGNLVAISNALGQVTRYTYDPNGNQLTVENPLGQVTSNAYDLVNRLVTVTDPLGNVTRYAYDELGRRTQVTDAKSQVTRFFYDPLGRLTNVIDAATGAVHFAYDKVGNRTAMTEPNGRTTLYSYDALNRLTQKQEPIGTYQYRYDGAGDRIGLTDANGQSITNVFDANRRLTAVKYPGGSQVTFTYDAAGNRIRMTDAQGTTTYAHDALNRLTNCTDSAGKTVSYAYDANGNRVSITYPGNRVVSYTFDALNRMETVRDWLGGVTTNTYDVAGNLAQVRSPNGTTARYGFDNAGRLTSLTNALPDGSVISSYGLTLDGVGNHLQSAQVDPIEPVIPTQTVSYAYDSDNRLTNAAGTAFTYDANGNMTARGADTFSYDYENRLTQAVVGGVSQQYQYDGVGNRLSATRAGVTTRYVLDVNGALSHVLAEADSGGTITAYYVYGRGLVSRITAAGSACYYHFDVRGSTVAMTDSAGNITDRYAYDPFGTLANSAGSTANPFKYVGRYGVMDEGNGLAYIRARYYSPELGRFVTKDPVTGNDGDPQSLNRYIYALNNPVRLIDVSGFSPREGSQSAALSCTDRRNQLLLDTIRAQDLLNEIEQRNIRLDMWINIFQGINDATATAFQLALGDVGGVASGLMQQMATLSRSAGWSDSVGHAFDVASEGFSFVSARNLFGRASSGLELASMALERVQNGQSGFSQFLSTASEVVGFAGSVNSLADIERNISGLGGLSGGTGQMTLGDAFRDTSAPEVFERLYSMQGQVFDWLTGN